MKENESPTACPCGTHKKMNEFYTREGDGLSRSSLIYERDSKKSSLLSVFLEDGFVRKKIAEYDSESGNIDKNDPCRQFVVTGVPLYAEIKAKLYEQQFPETKHGGNYQCRKFSDTGVPSYTEVSKRFEKMLHSQCDLFEGEECQRVG